MLTNAYKVYIDFHKIHQSDAALSHYDFIKQIALAWLDRENNWPEERKRKRAISESEESSLVIRRSRSRRNPIPSSNNSQATTETFLSGDSHVSKHEEKTIPMRNATVNEKTLEPNGALKCRLNTYVTHSPCPSTNKRAKCQLHRWARGRGKKKVRGAKLVVHCLVCRVDLCFKCWRTFHSCTDIIRLKDEIAKS